MNNSRISSVNLDVLISQCIQKRNIDEGSQKQSEKIYKECWNGLVRWIKQQLELDRTVIFPKFMNITQGKYEDSNDNEKHLVVQLLDNFTFANNLQQKKNFMIEIKYSSVKINFMAVSKLADIPKEIVIQIINNMFKEIADNIIGLSGLGEVDMGQLGRLIMKDQMMTYYPYIKQKQQIQQQKQTVQQLLEQRKSLNKPLPLQQSLKEPSVQIQYQINSTQQQSVQNNEMGYQQMQMQMNKSQFNKNMQSPTRRYNKPENMAIQNDMLGAGTDPIAKQSDFSVLVGNAQQLMNAQFVKPNLQKIRYPPILDKFSRTLAAPICSQKYNLSVSNRIGNKYTKTAERLYLDPQTKQVRYSTDEQQAITFTANPELLQQVATEDQVLQYMLGEFSLDTQDLLFQRVQSKQRNYQRYMNYIKQEISVDAVANIRQYWITNILDLIPGEFQNLDKEYVESMIDDMLNEVNQDYYDSVRKGILDYVLKDQDERMRIGIMETYDQVCDYGQGKYKGILADSEWMRITKQAREAMKNNLVICNKATLKMMDIWKKYETQYFLDLPTKKDTPMTIQYFIKVQEDRINLVKQSLENDWIKELIEIYQEELSTMGKNKKQAIMFFEANATLMSNQLRKLIEESLYQYKEFFNRFKKTRLMSAKDIIDNDKKSDTLLQDVFLIIKLKDESDQVVFNDGLDIIKQELVRLITDIVQCSHGFPRPENTLARRDKNTIWKVPVEDEVVCRIEAEIETILDINCQNIQEVLEIYNEFKYLLLEKDIIVNEFITSDKDRSEYLTEIQKYEKIGRDINSRLPFSIRTNMIMIDGNDIKQKFLSICEDLINILMKSINDQLLEKNQSIQKDIAQLLENIQQKAESEDQLVAIEQNIDDMRLKDQKIINDQFQDLIRWQALYYQQIQTYLFNKQEDEYNVRWDEQYKQVLITSEAVQTITEKVDHQEMEIMAQRESLMKNLETNKAKFIENIKILEQEVDELKTQYTANYMIEMANKQIDKLDGKLEEYWRQMEDINNKEQLMGMVVTEFNKLEDIKLKLTPQRTLWRLLRDYKAKVEQWTVRTSIFKLDPEEIERTIKQMYSQAVKLQNEYKNDPAPCKLATEVLKDINNFKRDMPLINIFCNKGLKGRHWQEISDIIELPQVGPDSDLALDKLIKLEMSKYLDRLEDISDTATKEFNIEQIMTKMLGDWDEVHAELQAYKSSGTFRVTGGSIEEIQTLLDDQIVKTQTMKGSPYAKIFELRISEWENWLVYTGNLVEYWIKVQQVWQYLEPIFASPDIIKSLPQEAAKFREVDSNWRNMMGKINSNTKVIEFTKNKKLLDILKESHNNLEFVQKGVYNFLEGKQTAFPRFYFLSNDELLEILRETKDPLRVQPHLKKCFEGIQKLQFDNEKKIHGMFSSEDEYVQFTQQVDTVAARGQVEQWLIQVEEKMNECIRHEIAVAHKQYQEMDRTQWILGRCGQAVLCVDMVYWTLGSEQALIDGGYQGAIQYTQTLTNQLEDIVMLTRQEISVLDRCTIEAMIVLDVHNRDLVKSLGEDMISKTYDFAWQSQLRYYFDPKDRGVEVRIINAIVDYTFEYLGNSPRLVITPLTDRCYRTLCSAVHLNYGGAPEGPAGTGKTETVKDLAKALARVCQVFNCSDGLDYKAMGKFFKGLASSGAWSCFDEFNRINLEVLSVVAQQIQTIQFAKADKRKNFEFEDCPNLKLIDTCNAFITMNPGYAGRAELPDNLKALFRSVAMMVPNYALIAKISLYSFGFSQAPSLANKIVTTYKLCNEQLSSQKHYDYGMRAVKSVLIAAGTQKRRYPDEDEQILVLRSILDVNVAKFLAFDMPLFKGITSDLFPGISLPEIDYQNMHDAIHQRLEARNLQSNTYFIEKIIQLYEMILVRHGLMVVGYPFAGKSTIIHVLAEALGLLQERGQMNEQQTNIITLNPKSIAQQLLYGFSDLVTNEWTDGLIAVKFRNLAKEDSPQRKWLLFDGPVDAIWIENMNTVLDDNRTLCLNSGEKIGMNKQMNMIFEPMDLLVASPATVSRCGMVFMEPKEMGWKPMFDSWINTLRDRLKQEDIEEVISMFEWSINHALRMIRTKFQEISPTQDQNLVNSLLRMFKVLVFEDFKDKTVYEKIEMKERHQIIQHRFIFCLIWSLGGSIVTESRKPFDLFLKKLFNGDIHPIMKNEKKRKIGSIPDRGLIYDYNYKVKDGKGEWIHWTEMIDPNESIPRNTQPQQIIVKTVDTIRYTYLLKNNIMNEYPTLFCGPTGTGKSAYINNLLMNELDKSMYQSIEVGFSAQTTCTQTQDIIDGKIDKKRRGIFGPKTGKAVIFVDDLNMPKQEEWGAQPPIEILRQLIDQGGWYDNRDKEKPFKQLVDLIFVAAMGTPGGGKTFITPRLLRHVNLISLTQFDNDTLSRIFSTILQWFFTSNGFQQDVIKSEGKIVAATLEIYQEAIIHLKPTPAKSHYLFNLRDFSKVILGICMAHKDFITNIDQVCRLWAHEVLRVFSDRLINIEDRLLLLDQVRNSVKSKFQLNFDTVFAHLDRPDANGVKDGKVTTLDEIRGLIFSDIGQPARKIYEEVQDFDKLLELCEDALRQYNDISDKRMDLVLFGFAIEHLMIIGRILKTPGGHALLVGVGGSGRQSLTKLAACVADYQVFSIEITRTYNKMDWREDIKKVLRMSGGKNEPTVFLFTDSQIKEEGFVEDLNTLLNTSEVPNLFLPEEKAELLELVRPHAKSSIGDANPAQLYNFFINLVKKNLHIVLCFSAIGENFSIRIRNFPSLVNCCTIDWFFEWPQDALLSVAKKFLGNIELDQDIRQKCVEIVQYYHISTKEWAQKFQDQLRRKYYVTPTSYLELIYTFQYILGQKRSEVLRNKNKYVGGYNQIIQTEDEVDKMKERLIKMKPELKKAAEDTELKVIEVTKEKKESDAIAEVVMKDEAVAQKAKDEANVIKMDCQKDLTEAKPILLQAEKALEVLQENKGEMDKLKTYKTVSYTIQKVMQCLMYLVYPKPTQTKKNEQTMKMEIDWWAASKAKMAESGFIQKLIGFDQKAVTEEQVMRLRKEFEDPQNKEDDVFEMSKIERASLACKCIMEFVMGVYNYYFIYKKIVPKEKALKESQTTVDELSAKLAVKQAELKKATDKVHKLNSELQQEVDNKDRLEKNFNQCSVQLERAIQLIDNLGGEKLRWKQLGEELGEFYKSLTGDVLISSGLIAYLGAFTSKFRGDMQNEWVKSVQDLQIPSSEKYSLINVCGDQVQIRTWSIDGLPQSTFSQENAIIMFKTRRWPLCIDPQGQANKWIKKMGSTKGIAVIKLTDPTFLRTLENCIQFGKPVLLENVGEELDPALTPILLKQTYVKGSTTYIKLGDQAVEYSPDFFFYITTKFRNPHYLPELSTKVCLLNFMITYDGLTDQLLGILVKKERPELEEEKERLIIEGAANKKQLAEIESQILEVLSSEGDILSDEKAINILTASKTTSNDINKKQTIAEQTEKEIDQARQLYMYVSQEASCLFFAISDLNNIDPMYQYSLAYYIDLFTQAIMKSEKNENLDIRLKNLQTYFLYSLYCNICRSLFEKDKLLFSFLLATRLFTFRGDLNDEYLRFLLTGGIALDEDLPQMPENSDWLTKKMWGEVNRLSLISGFKDFVQNFKENIDEYKNIFDNVNPEGCKLCANTQALYNFNSFQFLMILRTLRPDKMVPAIQNYVSSSLGAKFIDPPGFNLPQIYDDSSSVKPLVFILSPGSDPFQSLKVFGKQMDIQIRQISLGQGQGGAASNLIKQGVELGYWVVLQNCHLAESWMTALEKICEELTQQEVHDNFRLWLTSYPSKAFPTSILQNGVKMTNEPPKGLKANLISSLNIDPMNMTSFFEGCQQNQEFKRLIYGLCFFHAVIQERRKYGALGWCNKYEFNESDLRISAKQIRMFMDEMQEGDPVPFPALNYTTGECNYGGRVTDDNDRRLLMVLLKDYYNEKLLTDSEYNFTPKDIYKLPFDLNSHQSFIDYIKTLPLNSDPGVFGFNPNADITKDLGETNQLFDSLLICSAQTGGGSSGQNQEQMLNNICVNMIEGFPMPFDEEEASIKYPYDYHQSMNTFFTQELGRFNILIKVIRSSLSDLVRALKGEIILSPLLDECSKQIMDGKVPAYWLKNSYPSLKALGAYVSDLKRRIKFYDDWLNDGTPYQFWFSGLHFTQSFLTGCLQNYARKYTIPIDELIFDFEIVHEEVTTKPEDGAYVYGLFVEGARYNYDKKLLDESESKILFVEAPTIWFKPCISGQQKVFQSYKCPVYKTSERKGTLSTTGISTNFVCFINIPTDCNDEHWVKRGVALLTQLDD